MKIKYLADFSDFVPILAQWHHEQWVEFNPNETLDDRVAKIRAQARKSGVPTTFVAMKNSTVIGSASLVAHDMDTRMDLSPWLASVLVASEYRRRGVGEALVQRVVKESMSLGHEMLYLFTEEREAFYAKRGWRRLEWTEYCNHPVVIMFLDLLSQTRSHGNYLR